MQAFNLLYNYPPLSSPFETVEMNPVSKVGTVDDPGWLFPSECIFASPNWTITSLRTEYQGQSIFKSKNIAKPLTTQKYHLEHTFFKQVFFLFLGIIKK